MSDLVADTTDTANSVDKTAFEMGFKYMIKIDGDAGMFYVEHATHIGPFMREMYPHNRLISVKNLEKIYGKV